MICFKVTCKHQYSECKGTSSPIINAKFLVKHNISEADIFIIPRFNDSFDKSGGLLRMC